MGGAGWQTPAEGTPHQATLLRPGGRLTNSGSVTCYVNVEAGTVVTDGTAAQNLYIMPPGNVVLLSNQCWFFTFATASSYTTLNYESVTSILSTPGLVSASAISGTIP